MICFTIAIAVFLSLTTGAAFAADLGESETHPTIQVRARSEIEHKPDILLGDVAEFKGLPSDTPQKLLSDLRSVRLGDAPRHGEARYFTDVGLAQAFRGRLRKLEDAVGERIELRIPSKVEVIAKLLTLNTKDVEREIVRKARELCRGCEIEVTGLAFPVAVASLPSGAEWQIKMRSELPRGSFSLPLEIKRDDGTRRLFWISGHLSARKRVPVAKRAIPVGERIAADDWELQTREIAFVTEASAEDTELVSAWASRAISPGETISRGAFRREAAVKFGETIRVISGADGWEVAAEGVAQQGGFVGDLIRVRIPRTQKTVSGVLKDKGLVEVQ